MTRKDYILLAEALRCVRPESEYGYFGAKVWESCVRSIAAALEINNKRFDRERFMAACKA